MADLVPTISRDTPKVAIQRTKCHARRGLSNLSGNTGGNDTLSVVEDALRNTAGVERHQISCVRHSKQHILISSAFNISRSSRQTCKRGSRKCRN